MALHDFRCASCGYILRDHNVPIALGARRGAPSCPCSLSTTMDWVPQLGSFDAFTAFTADVNGTPTQIDSLHTLRAVERETERKFRDGIGQPLVWRDLSQNSSNRDVNSFGPSPQPTFETHNRRGIPFITRRDGRPLNGE